MRKERNKKLKGFSLIEVLFSVFLLTVGIIGVLGLISSGLKETLASREQLKAGFLAQEGVELVRNMRDDNWKSNQASFQGINAGTYCIINFASTSLTCGHTFDESRLEINASGYYVYNGPASGATKFYRWINITGAGNTRTVFSEVVWDRTNFLSEANCTLDRNCVFEKVTLGKWGEN